MSPSVTATAVVTPGRVFVFVKSIDLKKRTMTYDQAQFLTGEAANKAAAEDKQEVPVPNDYYIRNVNKRLRTAPITADAKILGSIALTQQVELKPVPLEAVATFAKTGQGLNVGFWITISATGQITKIEEQYIP